ncbi:magnesium transporter Mrs2p, mitochondrial [[Candida] anglica]
MKKSLAGANDLIAVNTYQIKRYKSTNSRNQTILHKLNSISKVDPSISFTDNTSYLQNEQESSVDPHDYTRFEDPISANITSAMYRQLQPITPNDSFVSCTTFNSQGNVVAVSKTYPKMAFLKENNLFPRDLRKIDTSSVDVVPSVVVRAPSSILVNLLHIKAIVKKDRVMIFDTSTPAIASKLGLFMYDLEMKLKAIPTTSSPIPYEFRALESILISVMSYLDAELKSHLNSCGTILDELEDQIDRNKLRELLIKSKSLASFYQKAVLIRDVLDEVLDSDETLAAMYLSDTKHYDPSVENPTDYADLEMLLEAYYNHCDEFVQQTGSLLNDIRATEEIVNIILDANRNSLMLFELQVTVYTLGFTVATLVPAFYGMNLKNYIEDSELGFGAVVVFSLIQGILVTSMMFRKLRKVQKLTMMGGASMTPMKPQHRFMPWENFNMWGERNGMREWLSQRHRWCHRLLYGERNTKFDRPTSREKDVIWRMINDDKKMR